MRRSGERGLDSVGRDRGHAGNARKLRVRAPSGGAAGACARRARVPHRGLGTDFAPLVVVADGTDWERGGSEAPPYGIPYASDDGFELVIPAEPRENFLVEVYAAHGPRESAERFADLIAVHELGHLHVREMGLDLPPGWLVEFLATYLACCFLVARRPEDASLWYALARAHADGVNPEHRSLEVLDELYFGVGPDNYIWYQNALTLMVERVQVDLGLDFALRLRAAGLTPHSDGRRCCLPRRRSIRASSRGPPRYVARPRAESQNLRHTAATAARSPRHFLATGPRFPAMVLVTIRGTGRRERMHHEGRDPGSDSAVSRRVERS